MTTTAAFCPLSLQTLADSNGDPIVGGKLYFYDAGTTTPRSSYSDSALSIAHSSPVLTDAYGRFPAIFLDVNAYKMVVKSATNVQLYSVDGLPGGVASSSSSSSSGTTIPTGMILGAHTDDVFDGWLPLNAKNIGNVSSGATARANDDVEDLFVLLWNKDSALTVSGGRGASAAADWAASKTINLPDYRGRTPVGASTMGNTVSGIITTFSVTDPDLVGKGFGSEGVQLTVAQLPTHTPSVTVAAGGSHLHTGNADSVAGHSHTGTTDSGGTHNHDLKTVQVVAAAGTANGVASGGATGTVGAESNGAHTHSFGTDVGGSHSHTLTIDASTTHVHSASVAAIGSDAKHANCQPSIICWFHIKI